MAEKQTTNTEAKSGGTKPQIALYQKIASREEEIIETLFQRLKSRNESVSLGAAKILINKILPDLKTVEVTGKDGGPIKLNIITGADYVSYAGKTTSSSEESVTTPAGTV